jgi:cytochrome c biogenesis protein CcmG/thiol:disulfide interchange protein DsbE
LAVLTLDVLLSGAGASARTHLRPLAGMPTPVAGAAAEACEAKPKEAKLNFTLKDMDGKATSLASLKGKVIVLDFWATWCVPCKTEIPGFMDLQDRYRESGLQVVGVSVDDPLETLKPYAAEMKINYLVLQGRGRDDLLKAFGVAAVPTTVVIGRDGKICRKYSGGTAVEAFETVIKPLM